MSRCVVVAISLFVSCLTGFQNPAQENPSFDVASVKLNTSGNDPSSNFPLGQGVFIRRMADFFIGDP